MSLSPPGPPYCPCLSPLGGPLGKQWGTEWNNWVKKGTDNCPSRSWGTKSRVLGHWPSALYPNTTGCLFQSFLFLLSKLWDQQHIYSHSVIPLSSRISKPLRWVAIINSPRKQWLRIRGKNGPSEKKTLRCSVRYSPVDTGNSRLLGWNGCSWSPSSYPSSLTDCSATFWCLRF